MISPSSIRLHATIPNILRIVVPLAVMGICGTVLWQRMVTMDGAAITTAIKQVTWMQWFLAGVATWCSFQAIGQYDAMGHRLLRTGINNQQAKHAGIRAIALAQTLGFGALTGSLVRWRCLPELSLWQATRASFIVTVGFTACWALLAVCALFWLGQVEQSTTSLLIGGGILCVALPLGHKLFASNLRPADIVAMILLCIIDMIFAASALFVLLPQGTSISFDALLAAYVVALGIGLISNSPGGAGAFELTLLALIPMTAPEPLIAAIIAFRIIYYLLPAALALAAIARPVSVAPKGPFPYAAWGLAQQSGQVRQISQTPALVNDLPGFTASIGPQHPNLDLRVLRRDAGSRLKLTTCYNTDPRTAFKARQAGWHVQRVAMEAMIRPTTWTTTGGRRQTLRRKLKQATRAGVSITQAPAQQSFRELSSIAHHWAMSHGGEMGFSMGRFCPNYLAQQLVFLIQKDAKTIGFVSFHTTPMQWTLDIIRHHDAIPNGAIHAAIVAAITAAKDVGVQQISLANTPDPRYTPNYWASKCAGLIQFKRSFAPIWIGRYHAAPTKLEFWISAILIGIAIHRPVSNFPWRLARKLNSIMQNYQVRKSA